MNVIGNSNLECEFHICIRQVMRLPRWVGFFPVSGLNKPSINELRFKTTSFCYIINILLIVGHMVNTCLSFYYFTINLELDHFTKFVFYFTGFFSAVSFSILARKWPKMTRNISKLEQSFAPMRTEKPNPSKFVIYSYAILVLALIEHILSVNYKLTFIKNCMKEQRINYEVVTNYIQVNVTHIFRFTTFSVWKAIIHMLVNLQATFIWTFIDVFIMCVGMYISNFFRDINKIISVQIAQVSIVYTEEKSVDWNSIRLHYSHAMMLLKQANVTMASLILLSFFSNIYYVCLQMFYSIYRVYDPYKDCPQEDIILSIDGIEYTVYYIYSLLFLSMRAFIVSRMAVQVNTEALKPLIALRNIPTQEYTLDVQRFVRQIRYCDPALCGICFSVTKQMLLSAMAAVITYEVVLLQNSRTRAYLYDSSDENEIQKNDTIKHFI